ncbi:MAG TPA: PKD domain-containing protein [Kofleriaceae bacterium]|nr:PKD domain-containing protein [Kofleriaceae bacterium]
MSRTSLLLVALALAAGCSFDVDYGKTAFQCEATSDCPDGFACVSDECRPAGGDGAPTAAFTSDSSFLLVSLDATSSTDPDGDALDHAWSFGDDSTGTGATVSHSYETAGSYEVTLTVTDDDGNTDSVSNQVSVTAAPEPLAQDGFERSVDPGWGSAVIGGAWSLDGELSRYSVANGRGRVEVAPGIGPAAFLQSIAADSVDFTVSAAVSELATGSGFYVSLVGRRISAGNNYESSVVFRPDGQVAVDLSKRLGGDELQLESVVVPGLTYTAGKVVHIRAQFFGTDPTTLRTRAWADGEEEPGDWQLTADDSEPGLQEPGELGINSYLSAGATTGINVAYDDLLVVPVE